MAEKSPPDVEALISKEILPVRPGRHDPRKVTPKKGVICVANQRIPNVCRIAGAACCGAIRNEIFSLTSVGGKRPFDPNINSLQLTQKMIKKQL